MKDIFRVVAGRLAGALVGAVIGVASARGLGDLSPSTSQELQALVANAIMLAGYGVAHKLFDRKPAK